MEPITLTAIAVGIFLSGCGTRAFDGADSTPSTDAGKDAFAATVEDSTPTDSTSIGSDADADAVATADVHVDSFIDTSTTAQPCATAFPLLQGKATLFAKAPCGDSGVINDIDDNGLGTCSDFQQKNAVFQLGDKSIANNQMLQSVPDQVCQANYENIAMTAMDGKAYTYGLLQLYGITATPSWQPFASATVDQKTFTPSFGKGVAYASGKLFVVTSNISFDTGKAVYAPGSVLVYPDGSTTPQALFTQGHNPTGIGTWADKNGTHVGIVNTESLDPSGDTNAQHSSLVVFNADTLAQEQKIDLPFSGLGLAGEIGIGNGKLAIPSADNSGRVVVLDTANLSAAAVIVTDPAAQTTSGPHLISFAKIIDHFLVMGNYNTGTISTWDLTANTPSLEGSPIKADDNLSDNLGIADAICFGGKVLIAVGPNVLELQ